MAFRIGRKEAIGSGLIRLIGDDSSAVLPLLCDRELEPEERVHLARRRLKRIRSLLWALRQVSSDETGGRRRLVRDAARLLAGARDAEIAAATARRLLPHVDADDAAALRAAIEAIDAEAGRLHRRAVPASRVAGLVADAVEGLAPAKEESAEAALAKAVRRTFRRCRSLRRTALRTGEAAALHEWRKALQRLSHLIEIGGRRHGGRGARVLKAAGRTADLLGEEHDHAVAAARLEQLLDDEATRERVLGLIEARRAALRRKALRSGRAIDRRRP